VERIAGVMVSATSAGGQITKNWKGALIPGIPDQVHPDALTDRVLSIAETAASRERIAQLAEGKVFGRLPADLDERERGIVEQTLWSIASDETYFQIAKAILPEHPADLTLVYFGGPDVAGHRFWRHYRPWEFSWSGSSPRADAALACTLPNYYVWVDEMVGELVSLAGPGTTVLVLSDHGMHAIATDAPNERYTTGDHQDAPPGVIVAAGPGIAERGEFRRLQESGALTTHGSVYSVAPTVLGLLGIPAARDLRAQAERSLLTREAAERIEALGLVETHDDGFREPALVELPAESEQEFVKRMAALGYILVPEEAEDSVLVDPDRFPAPNDPKGVPACP
jgi:hypothetical protein